MSIGKHTRAWLTRILLVAFQAGSVAAAEGPLPDCPDLVWGDLPAPGGSPFPDEEALCAAIPGETLPAEFLPPLPPMTRDELGIVTTGFLHRWEVVKNNRIPPRGFRWDSIYVEPPYEVAPKGNVLEDPDYRSDDPSQPLDGTDVIAYEIELPPELRERAASVRARLISQSVPPYFLSQIFSELATAKADPHLVATGRQLTLDGSFLHYLGSRFDADAVQVNGESYLADWKLEVASDERPVADARRAVRSGGRLLPTRR